MHSFLEFAEFRRVGCTGLQEMNKVMHPVKGKLFADDVCLQVFFRRLLKVKTELGIKSASILKIGFGKLKILIGLFQPFNYDGRISHRALSRP